MSKKLSRAKRKEMRQRPGRTQTGTPSNQSTAETKTAHAGQEKIQKARRDQTTSDPPPAPTPTSPAKKKSGPRRQHVLLVLIALTVVAFAIVFLSQRGASRSP